MGLFDQPYRELAKFIDEKKKAGEAKEFFVDDLPTWPDEPSLVLQEEAAMELGKPGVGSFLFFLWTDSEKVANGRVTLVGPDVQEVKTKELPVGQVILVGADFTDEYEFYSEIRDAIYQTQPAGFMIRTLPSQQSLWCRLSRDAYEKGFTLPIWAASIIRNVRQIEYVKAVETFCVTTKADLGQLERSAFETGRIVGAMMKMVEEMDFDCENCDYQSVCDAIRELRVIRRRMQEGQGR